MGVLRDRLNLILDLKRYSKKTKRTYLGWMIQLKDYCRKTPDIIPDEDIQKFLHHIQTERHLAWSTCNQASCAISFFYRNVMERRDFHGCIEKRKTPQTIPEILTIEEIKRLIDCTYNLKHKTLLMTVYGTGVRVSELVQLRIKDIGRSRKMLRVTQGKGMKDRYTIIPDTLMHQFDLYWKHYRPTDYLFCAHGGNTPLSIASAQHVYDAAKKKPTSSKETGFTL